MVDLVEVAPRVPGDDVLRSPVRRRIRKVNLGQAEIDGSHNAFVQHKIGVFGHTRLRFALGGLPFDAGKGQPSFEVPNFYVLESSRRLAVPAGPLGGRGVAQAATDCSRFAGLAGPALPPEPSGVCHRVQRPAPGRHSWTALPTARPLNLPGPDLGTHLSFDDVSLATFSLAATLVVLLPGPDTLVVVRNLVRGGRRMAARTVLGVLSGLTIWVVVAVLGIPAMLRASQDAYDGLRVVGAAYLVYLGVRSLRGMPPPRPLRGDY